MTRQASAEPDHATPGGPRRVALVLFLVTFLVFAATASRGYLCLDVWSSNLASYQLATTGTPNLDGVPVPQLDGHPLRWVYVDDNAPNGHVVITRSPAAVIAGLPAYLLTQPGSMTVLPAAITAALLTALAVLFIYGALLTLVRRRQALVGAGVLAFTTPVWSVAANGIWPQTIGVLGIAITAWAAARERWWALGLGGVLLLWARPHAALIVAIVALALAWRERSPGIALRAGTPGVVSLGLLSWWTHWVDGSWNPTALYGAGSFAEVHQSVLDVANQLAMWISPDRGLLVFTPILLVLLPALVTSWRTVPFWARALLVAGLAYTIVQAGMIGFTGGDPIYGYRYGLEFLACATPAFVVAAVHVRGAAARLLAPVIGLQFVVILLGAVIERIALPYTQAWTDNAFVHAMVGAPALIPLALVLATGTALVVDRWRRESEAADAVLAEGELVGSPEWLGVS